MILILAILIFLRIIMYLIILDVILSWVSLLGINFRPKFLKEIIDPLYGYIKKIIPTTIGPFDFTPIVVFIIISFLSGIIFTLFPESQIEFFKFINAF